MTARTSCRSIILLAGAAFASVSALAQTNVFDLHLQGKEVGHDTYTLTKGKTGYKVASHLSGAYKNTDLDFKDAISYDENYLFLDGSQTSQNTNSQFSYLPSKDRKEMTIAVAANGHTSSNFEPITGTDLIFLPPFDAGAAQALLLQAVLHPAEKDLYTVYLTSNYGMFASPGSEPLPGGIHYFKAVWLKGVPLTGLLDGKQIPINTYALAFGKFRWIFFADEQNNLMQVNVSLLRGSYIRSKFKLNAPARKDAAESAPKKDGTPE